MSAVDTPALIIDGRTLDKALQVVASIRRRTGCRVLYAMKPLISDYVLRRMKGRVDGFAASSLFESTLAREVLGHGGSVHVTTPGFRADEVLELARLCDYVVLNSLPQWERLSPLLRGRTSIGLRVNPQLSLVRDKRYDPCRTDSKLGVSLERLAASVSETPRAFDGVEGVHFHTNCDAGSYGPLWRTVRLITSRLKPLLARARWINLGGGYCLDSIADLTPLEQAVRLLREQHGLEVFIEPGAALVRHAGTLVASVIDLFESDRSTIAVLDTTVNHLPEVYEYQFAPDVVGDSEDGAFSYVLAGSSCLAGDVFGAYAFDAPLRVGSRVVFPDVGAYTLVKAHMFNGISLPTLYSIDEAGALCLIRRFSYRDFSSTFRGRGYGDL